MLASQATYPSVLALNAILLEAPEALTTSYSDVLVNLITQGIKNSVSCMFSLSFPRID